MGETETAETAVEITELEKIEASRVDGVRNPANGTPILMMKALPEAQPELPAPVPAVEVKLDNNAIDEEAFARLFEKAMGNYKPPVVVSSEPPRMPEADRARAVAMVKAINADGELDESPDIAGGQEAITLIARLIGYECEELAAGYTGESYDISLLLGAVDCLKRWLCMERAGEAMADVVEASAAPTVAKETNAVETVDAGRDEELLKSLVADAVTEATKGAKAEIESLRAELAKVKATPIPGGPVMSITQPPTAVRNDERARTAAYYREMAKTVTDPKDADGYRQLARQLEEQTPKTD